MSGKPKDSIFKALSSDVPVVMIACKERGGPVNLTARCRMPLRAGLASWEVERKWPSSKKPGSAMAKNDHWGPQGDRVGMARGDGFMTAHANLRSMGIKDFFEIMEYENIVIVTLGESRGLLMIILHISIKRTRSTPRLGTIWWLGSRGAVHKIHMKWEPRSYKEFSTHMIVKQTIFLVSWTLLTLTWSTSRWKSDDQMCTSKSWGSLAFPLRFTYQYVWARRKCCDSSDPIRADFYGAVAESVTQPKKGAAKPLPAVAKVGGAPCTSGSLFFEWRDGFSAGNNHGLTETFLSNCPFIHFYPFLPWTFRIVGQRLRAKCSTSTGTRPRFWSNWRTQLNGDSKQLPTGNS